MTVQSVSPIQLAFTTAFNQNNTPFLQTKLQSTVKPSFDPNYYYMDFQISRPITKKRPPNKQKHAKGNNFTNQKNDNFANNNNKNPIARLLYTIRNQSQEHNYNQQMPKRVPQSVFSK